MKKGCEVGYEHKKYDDQRCERVDWGSKRYVSSQMVLICR
jgi:hypothetical protein